MSFDKCFASVLEKEGILSDHQADRGGLTKYGISQKNHPDLDINGLTLEQAKEIYRQEYWLPASCDKLTEKLALIHFDSAVQHGVQPAKLFLQDILGVKKDGIVGKQTLAALYRQLELGNEEGLIKSYLKVREEFYYHIIALDQSQKVFLKGWLNRLNNLKKELNIND